VSIAIARANARRVFQEAGCSLPVDLDDVLGWHGLGLSREMGWPDRLCARYDPARREVKVNGRHRETRQRFSIAHELGHCVLGHEQVDIDHDITQIFGDEDESYDVAGDLEKEANSFAVELLMPRAWVQKQATSRSTSELIALIQNDCQVSESAAWYRIMELRLAGFSSAPRRKR